jgi:hypothetical protein
MKIQEQHLYHGAALTQIVQHQSFKALNRASEKYGHYLVNTDRHVFVKYRTNDKSPWQYTFSPEELSTIDDEIKHKKRVFLCLVCGQTTVCALDADQIQVVLDLTKKEQQWIRVEVPSGSSCHVSGSKGKLEKTVPHNSFPDKVFE